MTSCRAAAGRSQAQSFAPPGRNRRCRIHDHHQNKPNEEDIINSETIIADKTYSEAVSRGQYDLYQGGLNGKHDNVRTQWEDQIRALRLRPILEQILDDCRARGRRTRITDLGAGSGEGLRLLLSCNERDADLSLDQGKLLTMDMIERYIGTDLCTAMVEQGNANFADEPAVEFRQGDFSQGFPLMDEDPMDLYYCTYASFSHLNREQVTQLFSEIAVHADDGAILVGEWLGKHSLEWPCYWDNEGGSMHDYSMSWLQDPGGDGEPEHFPMSYWSGTDLREMVADVNENIPGRIEPIDIYDCSMLVGRHVDTHTYNTSVAPLRSAVNRLFETNVRTDLNDLRATWKPIADHDQINAFFADLVAAWNRVIDYLWVRLEDRIHPCQMDGWKSLPAGVQMALLSVDRMVDMAYWLQVGDPRANVVEPQLAFVLRNLEQEFQTGAGCGHALNGIFRIVKD